jgi:hypothetical protein
MGPWLKDATSFAGHQRSTWDDIRRHLDLRLLSGLRCFLSLSMVPFAANLARPKRIPELLNTAFGQSFAAAFLISSKSCSLSRTFTWTERFPCSLIYSFYACYRESQWYNCYIP